MTEREREERKREREREREREGRGERKIYRGKYVRKDIEMV